MIADPGPCPNQGNQQDAAPCASSIRPRLTLRQLLITRGAIVPRAVRPKPPVLRMDARGKRFAAKHIEEYWADPYLYNSRPFWQPDPDEWIDTKEFPPREVA